MRNICLLFFGILCGLVFSAQAQISVSTINPGPYGVGSSIAIPINFPNNQSEFKIGNVFTLYISDAAGVFAGNGSQIGLYNGFFTPAINGTIPNLPAGNGYKLRIVASDPAQVIDVPGNITINDTFNVITLTPSLPSNNLGGDNLGWCPTGARNDNSIILKSNATTGTSVTVQLKNLGTGSISNFTETSLGISIPNINFGSYALVVTATKIVGGESIKSIRTYYLHNSPLSVNIIDNGTTIGCINSSGAGANIVFPIGFSGIINNDPSTIYSISWGDGESEQRTIYEIKQNSESISHIYRTTSCGQPTIPGPPDILNSFKATIAAINQYTECSESRSTTGYAQIFLNPEARITPPSSIGCVNQKITFINSSIGGNRSNCSTQMDYTWYINGTIAKQSPTNDPFEPVFTTPGNYIIKLVASNGVGSCQPSETSVSICIQEPPKPAFDITTSTTGCAPFLVKIEDNSFIDPSCVNAPAPTYNWIVTNANGVRFTNFTNNVKDPEILFTDPGVYSIVLEISSGACGGVRSAAGTPIIIINGAPTISLATDTKLCRLGSYLFDNIPGSPTQTIFTGTQVDLADTYTWTVTDINGNALTSADYTFDPGSNPNSKHPSINFKRNIPYIIKVTHKNTCASVTRSQRIEFVSAPTINLGADQNICFTQASVNLEANVIGNVLSGRWEGGLGTFSTPNNTTTTYTPTIAERISGLVTLKYTVTTDLQQPCKTVTADIKIFIKPEIKITSSATKIICTGTALNYAPTANLTSTSFTWTATGTANAGGFNDQATPSIFIADVLTNSDPINNATVTYTITPINDGCQGQPFTYTVTITPIPILTATPAFPSICSNQSSAITITSNLLNTRYTYTSTAPAGVTGNTNSAINAIPTNTGINDNLINNTAIAQTVTYTITPISDNNCAGLPVTVNIIVQPLPTIPIAGVDESICSKGTYTLKGNKARIGSGKWSQISTFADVVITPDNAENATVSGLVAGNTYTFRWTISTTADCSLWDDISITVNPVSVGGTTTGTNVVCAGTNSGTITLSNQVGNVVRWESSEDGTNWQTITNTTTTLTFSNINVNTSYRAVVQSGACAIAYSTETLVRTNTAAVIANAGTNQTLCNINNLQLDGNDPLTNTGLWTVESGQSVRFDDPTFYNTRVNDLVAGETYTFRWTITALAPCQPTWAEVKIFNSALLQDNTISAPTIACTNQIITVTGSTPTGGNGLFTYVWESSSDGSNWTVINGQINKDLNVTVAASLYYRRTVNSASCTMMSNIILITAIPPISKNTIAADQTICEAINPALIAGSEPTGGDGKSYTFAWEQSTDGTTWTLISGADGKDFQPPSLTQTTIYRRLVSSAACAGNFQSISNPSKITVNQNAKAEFTYANNIGCAPFLIDATNVKAVPYPALNKTYTWYVNGALLGTGIDFPGYTIATDNQTVEIKLVTESVLDCSPAEIAYTFSTRQNITAAFIQDKTEGCGPLDVMFTNTSTQLTGASFNWNFGNGTTSNLSQPGTIQFLADPAGEDKVYTITLGVTTPCGTNEFSSTVTVKPNPVALFSPHKTSGCSPFTVQFSNTSPGNNNTFTFDFGDGTPTVTTNNKNSVTHTYTTTTVQNFIVKMTASNGCGTSESQYTINVSPNTITPELVVNANQLRGCAPLSVDFFNNTIGASFYRYTFGDGSVITSNNTLSEKQTHVFTLPGTYTVELFATNGCSSATTTETITVLAQPTVAFTSDVTSGCIGSVVKFKNLSQDAVSYLWDFGDGQTSTAFEPTHTYLGQAKNYTVTLTAVNALGCPKTYAIANYIRIAPPPTADFIIAPASIISIPDYTFKFTDASTNGAQTYKWTFGDGDESTLKDPTHKFTDTGKYLVTMRTYNEFGCVDSLQKTVQIIGVPGYVYLPNSFIPGGTSSPLQKFTAVGSGIKSWRMQIFNKWGQVVWETTQLDDGKPVEGWDGSYNGVPQPQGIYFWKLDVELINGTEWKGMTYDNKAPKRTGEIYLIR